MHEVHRDQHVWFMEQQRYLFIFYFGLLKNNIQTLGGIIASQIQYIA